MQEQRKSVLVDTIDRVFIADRGWVESVEIRIEFTERQVHPQFPFRADKHYVRAYAGGRIVEHVFEPYKTIGTAKRRAKTFAMALRASADRKSSAEGRDSYIGGGRP